MTTPNVCNGQPPAAEAELRRRGHLPGAPAHITAATQAVDAAVCRRLVCPGCRRRGLDYRPFRGPGGRYEALAVCPRCGAAEPI
jgi:hypothetical protein